MPGDTRNSICNTVAKSLSTKDMTAFWKSIKTMNNINIHLATSIKGLQCVEHITEMWS